MAKRSLSHADEKWVWDNKSHTCHICGQTVTKISEAEFDHVRAHSAGGATTPANAAITHRSCNRRRGAGSLTAAQKRHGYDPAKKPKKPFGGMFQD